MYGDKISDHPITHTVWTQAAHEWTCPLSLPSCILEPESVSGYISTFYVGVVIWINETLLLFMLDKNIVWCSSAHPCIPLNTYIRISFWSSLTFCRLLKTISSILPCQVKSMCSNGSPIHLLSTPLIPVPSGDDRFAGNDFFGFDFLSTEDVDPEADCWLGLPPGKFGCCWFFIYLFFPLSFSTYWCCLT